MTRWRALSVDHVQLVMMETVSLVNEDRLVLPAPVFLVYSASPWIHHLITGVDLVPKATPETELIAEMRMRSVTITITITTIYSIGR